ncbi:MAG TPA: hypothetical protein VNP92_35215 [Actinophytocola sp.]|nr:hypothetical protein [Actinophytocola sp.]
MTAMAAAALTGCSSSPDYAAVCVDEQTQERVSDYECDDHGSYGGSYIWYYLGSGQRVPSVGSRVSGGSTSEPSGSVQRGLPSSGGSSVGSSSDYGGFGSSSGHVSS